MEELNLWLHYRRLADDTKADARLRQFMKLQNQYIDEIINGRYCRRCKNAASATGQSPHGKVVVNGSKPLSQCRYAKIQRWLDFLVDHRDLIVDWPEYCVQIKHVFQVLSRRKNGPPMDWHYRQLFHEDMPRDEIPKVVETIQEISPTPVVETASGSDRHRREFLRFFIDFYLTEYGLMEDVGPIQWESELISDLYVDCMGLVSLGEALMNHYPEEMQRRFPADNGTARVPYEFLCQQLTLEKLYEALFVQ